MQLIKKNIELTLCILKPHVVVVPHVLKRIKSILNETGFEIICSRKCQMNSGEVVQMYGEHKEKFFYNRLVTFMTSGAVELLVLARENAISELRSICGPTKVYRTQFTHPDSLRGMFGLSDTRNAVHGSDSVDSALREIEVFFPDLKFRNPDVDSQQKC